MVRILGEASVYAKGNVTCLVITKQVFDRARTSAAMLSARLEKLAALHGMEWKVLGPLRDFLKKNLAKHDPQGNSMQTKQVALFTLLPDHHGCTLAAFGSLVEGCP